MQKKRPINADYEKSPQVVTGEPAYGAAGWNRQNPNEEWANSANIRFYDPQGSQLTRFGNEMNWI